LYLINKFFQQKYDDDDDDDDDDDTYLQLQRYKFHIAYNITLKIKDS